MNAPVKIEHLAPGAHDIPAEEYHGDPCPAPGLSASLAWLLVDATPLHAWTKSPRLNPMFAPDHKAAFDIGTAAHELITGKGRGIHVVYFDSYRSKAAQEERDAARLAGFVPLLQQQAEDVEAMIYAADIQMKQHGIGNPFQKGETEITLLWDQDNVCNRCMVDCIDHKNRVMYDYKTCAGYADPERWVRSAMGHGTDLRAAHYLAGAKAVFGGEWTYRFVVQENTDPFLLSVVELSEGALIMGSRKLARARQIWGDCLSSNSWPGYSTQIAVVEPPMFHEAKWLEREDREFAHQQKHGEDILRVAFSFQAPTQKGA